jgi:hypothetical protein
MVSKGRASLYADPGSGTEAGDLRVSWDESIESKENEAVDSVAKELGTEDMEQGTQIEAVDIVTSAVATPGK